MENSSGIRAKLCACICAMLVFNGVLPVTAIAQEKSRPVVISFGQPNIWSLEQAHYLLARMHRQNLDLQAKGLDGTNLDPNATNATRINILKSLLEVGVSYDQGMGFQNKQLVRNTEFNSQRRIELTTRRDNLRPVATQLERDIAGLEYERTRMVANNEPAAAIELKVAEITQKKADLAAVNRELADYNTDLNALNATPTGTPQNPEVSATPFDSKRLPSSALDKVIEKNVEKILSGANDPRLNATTMLDNHVQMQYEIIAKQLTLLRDEVGPGERLVFLELPQSIYTTPGDGDNKMAQVWWHINGYTRTDESSRLLIELGRIYENWEMVKRVEPFVSLIKSNKVTLHTTIEKACGHTKSAEKSSQEELENAFIESFSNVQCEFKSAEQRVIKLLLEQASNLFARAEQRGVQNTNKLVEAVRNVIEVETLDDKPHKISKSKKGALSADSEDFDVNKMREKLLKGLHAIYSQQNKSMVGDNSNSLATPQNTSTVTLGDVTDFVPLGARADKSGNNAAVDIPTRDVRTIDIIPRQSSLNVNDVQATVKATGIAAAFKFLFGLAGSVNYQRQREQYEQYLHQELYASGFGKGETDFGWTFGAVPGTKRVAPGVRTTYAVMVVPQEAESIVLSARGCYFKRKDDQPLNYADTANSERWLNEGKIERRQCSAEQQFILPIPGGGNTNNFWVTRIDYDAKPPGEYVTASISGKNFSPQIGVLVNGVALKQSIGLAQPLLRIPGKDGSTGDECANAAGICGHLERVDPEQIVISFKMPADSKPGTPTITLVSPGRSRDLNKLPLTINDRRNSRLNENEKDVEKAAAYMFGVRPKPTPPSLAVHDLQTFRIKPNLPRVIGLLKGANFKIGKDEILINGTPISETDIEFKSPELYRLEFDLPIDDNIYVTVVRKAEQATENAVVGKSFPNIAALKINRVEVISYNPPSRRTNGVMVVRIIGKGLDAGLKLDVRGASAKSEILEVTANEAILKLVNPEPSAVVTLTHPSSGERLRAVVLRDAKQTTSTEVVAAQ